MIPSIGTACGHGSAARREKEKKGGGAAGKDRRSHPSCEKEVGRQVPEHSIELHFLIRLLWVREGGKGRIFFLLYTFSKA